MSRLRFLIAISLDGYVAGPDQSLDDPLGKGGMDLHQWVFALAAWRRRHGLEGGEDNASTEVVERSTENVGAVIMGRNMFGGRGEWGTEPWSRSGAEPWNGWWGDDPPFHVPVFVLTHHPREPLVMQGGTTFTFVTGGSESALAQARAAAGEQDVLLAGGANAAQQYLRAGLVDELQLHLVPILLGSGERLLDGLGEAQLRLECTSVIEAPGVTHLTYRTLR
jgi:dihydrofolate reductase